MTPTNLSPSNKKQSKSIASGSKSPQRSESANKYQRSASRQSAKTEKSKSLASRDRSASAKKSIYDEHPDLHPDYLLKHVKQQNEKHLKESCEKVFYRDSRSANLLRGQSQLSEAAPEPAGELIGEKPGNDVPEVIVEKSDSLESSTNQPSEQKSTVPKAEEGEILGLLARIKRQSEQKKHDLRKSYDQDKVKSRSQSRKKPTESKFKEIFRELYLSKD